MKAEHIERIKCVMCEYEFGLLLPLFVRSARKKERIQNETKPKCADVCLFFVIFAQNIPNIIV